MAAFASRPTFSEYLSDGAAPITNPCSKATGLLGDLEESSMSERVLCLCFVMRICQSSVPINHKPEASHWRLGGLPEHFHSMTHRTKLACSGSSLCYCPIYQLRSTLDECGVCTTSPHETTLVTIGVPEELSQNCIVSVSSQSARSVFSLDYYISARSQHSFYLFAELHGHEGIALNGSIPRNKVNVCVRIRSSSL